MGYFLNKLLSGHELTDMWEENLKYSKPKMLVILKYVSIHQLNLWRVQNLINMGGGGGGGVIYLGLFSVFLNWRSWVRELVDALAVFAIKALISNCKVPHPRT